MHIPLADQLFPSQGLLANTKGTVYLSVDRFLLLKSVNFFDQSDHYRIRQIDVSTNLSNSKISPRSVNGYPEQKSNNAQTN
jgi:hypothetical protein